MRPINADALKERMYHYAFEEDTGKWDSGCWIRYKLFEKAVDESPTIDPVKHGRWIKYPGEVVSEDGMWGETLYDCSECGCSTHVTSNYCRKCGARMDLGEEWRTTDGGKDETH